LTLNDSHTRVCARIHSHHCVGKTGIVYINFPVGGLTVLSCGFINKAVSKLNYFFI